jgi:predicted SprT family Zn-dependent metalloprotease
MILAEILITFAHELGHYEKWRDGKSITERGAEKRAISIYNQIYDKYLERENAIIK